MIPRGVQIIVTELTLLLWYSLCDFVLIFYACLQLEQTRAISDRLEMKRFSLLLFEHCGVCVQDVTVVIGMFGGRMVEF